MKSESQRLARRRRGLLRIADKLRFRGAYVDYWTCVHVATGLLLGFLLARVGMEIVSGLVLAAALLVLWELVEPPLHRLFGQRFPEKATNQLADVVCGLAGCAIGFTLLSPYHLWSMVLGILDFLAK